MVQNTSSKYDKTTLNIELFGIISLQDLPVIELRNERFVRLTRLIVKRPDLFQRIIKELTCEGYVDLLSGDEDLQALSSVFGTERLDAIAFKNRSDGTILIPSLKYSSRSFIAKHLHGFLDLMTISVFLKKRSFPKPESFEKIAAGWGDPDEPNSTYDTAIVVWFLLDYINTFGGHVKEVLASNFKDSLARGLTWLLLAQNTAQNIERWRKFENKEKLPYEDVFKLEDSLVEDSGWGAFKGASSNIETTSIVTIVLCQTPLVNEIIVKDAIEYLINNIESFNGEYARCGNLIETAFANWALSSYAVAVEDEYSTKTMLDYISKLTRFLLSRQNIDRNVELKKKIFSEIYSEDPKLRPEPDGGWGSLSHEPSKPYSTAIVLCSLLSAIKCIAELETGLSELATDSIKRGVYFLLNRITNEKIWDKNPFVNGFCCISLLTLLQMVREGLIKKDVLMQSYNDIENCVINALSRNVKDCLNNPDLIFRARPIHSIGAAISILRFYDYYFIGPKDEERAHEYIKELVENAYKAAKDYQHGQ